MSGLGNSKDTGSSNEVTQLIDRWQAGDQSALQALIALVYDDLRVHARRYMSRERDGHTLNPTGLVHEAYVRLIAVDLKHAKIETRVHFFAAATQAMRRVLVEHARRYMTARRASPKDKVALEDDIDRPAMVDSAREVLAVDEALDELRADYPRQARMVELRYFGGLSDPEIAEALSISLSSVARDWRAAKVMLGRFLPPEFSR